MAKLLGRPLREIIKKTLPKRIIELITICQKGKLNNNNNNIYFNAFRKIGKYYDKYNARKQNKSSIPAATHKSKAENKPKEKKINNKRPYNNTNL